ncbi:hypothetical protein HDU97_006130 [Phlyctochytrium planicorne]|nr:hypothetical protein HDU97_006130 [Phlyctochytrium planicorne]
MLGADPTQASSTEDAAPLYHSIVEDVLNLPDYSPAISGTGSHLTPSNARFDATGAYILPVPFDASFSLRELTIDGSATTSEVQELVDEYVDGLQKIRKLQPSQNRVDELTDRIRELGIDCRKVEEELDELKETEAKEAKKLEKIEAGKGIKSFTAKLTGNLEKLKSKENANIERLKESILEKEAVVSEKKEAIRDRKEERGRLENGPLTEISQVRNEVLKTISKPFNPKSSNPVFTNDANHIQHLESLLLPLYRLVKQDLDATTQAKTHLDAFKAHINHAFKRFKGTWDNPSGKKNQTTSLQEQKVTCDTKSLRAILKNDASPAIAEAQRLVGGIYEAIQAFPNKFLSVRVDDVQTFLNDPFYPHTAKSNVPITDLLLTVEEKIKFLEGALDKVIFPSLTLRLGAISKALLPIENAVVKTQREVLKYRVGIFDRAVQGWASATDREIDDLVVAWGKH